MLAARLAFELEGTGGVASSAKADGSAMLPFGP